MSATPVSELQPPPVEVSFDEQERLLALARFAVLVATRGEPELAFDAAIERTGPLPARQVRRGAAFVTLTAHERLRGCVGNLDPSRPLAWSVAAAAISATLHDTRFRPVDETELPDLEIEVSVLGPTVALPDPRLFRPGIDGLVVERGPARGLLLPEVATMYGLDGPAMLEATCRKAGLPPEAWQAPGTTILAFRTERFGGPALV